MSGARPGRRGRAEPRRAIPRGLRAEGFAADLVDNGPDGLHRADAERYDALVLDIMLPGMSGYDVLRRLRAGQVWTPVLMLTAKDGEYDIADALDLVVPDDRGRRRGMGTRGAQLQAGLQPPQVPAPPRGRSRKGESVPTSAHAPHHGATVTGSDAVAAP